MDIKRIAYEYTGYKLVGEPVATFVRSGYKTAQEVKIDLLFFLELPKTALASMMNCKGSVKVLVATLPFS